MKKMTARRRAKFLIWPEEVILKRGDKVLWDGPKEARALRDRKRRERNEKKI